jgi:hypothetical protein
METRPPFIGLAHELIEAYYSGKGILVDHSTMIVGSKTGWSPNEITDNAFRRAHGVPMR